MAGNIKGITIEFNGDTTKLDKALREVRNSTKDIDKELKQVDKALKFNPTSVELWRQKQELLRQKITQTEANLKKLKDAQAQMDAKGVDKNSQEYRELQREIITAESKLKTFKKQLDAIGNANLKALSAQLKEIGDKMTSVGKTMTTKVTAPIVAGYTLASKYASDYEENLNKLDVAFGSNSQAVKDWANNAGKEFGLSKVQATDAASAFGALGKGIGLTEAEAADMSTTLTGLSADLGSYFNVGVDESSKALEGIFTGESEALKKFGVVMTDTNLQKFAEDQGLVWKEMDQTQKTTLRYQYVLAKTKDAQGDFSRTSDGTANSIKIFRASVQDLATSIGTNLLPIITPIVQKITEWVNKFNELPEPAQKVITIIGLIVAAVGPLLIVLGTLVSSIGAIVGIAPALVGAMGVFVTGIAPVIAAIAALIAIGVLLYKNWDTIKVKLEQFKQFMITTWNNIKTYVTNLVTRLVQTVINLWTTLRNRVSAIVSTLRNTLVNLWNNIKANVTGIVTSIKNSAVNTWNALKSAVTSTVSALKDSITNKISSLWDTLSSLWSSIRSGASSAWEAIKSAMISPIQSAKDTLLGIVDMIRSWFPIKLGDLFTFKLPHVSVGSKTVKVGDKEVTVPTFSINWYAKGGIFDSASLIGVGEAGPEAVVPLDRFWEEIRNSNAKTDALLARQNQILLAVLEEVGKEKNFKVDGIWAGRYVNSLVR